MLKPRPGLNPLTIRQDADLSKEEEKVLDSARESCVELMRGCARIVRLAGSKPVGGLPPSGLTARPRARGLLPRAVWAE